MNERVYKTPCGDIHYWINMEQGFEHITLIFLPGLTWCGIKKVDSLFSRIS